MADTEPVFVEVETPTDPKDGEKIDISEKFVDKAGTTVDIQADIFTKAGTNINIIDTDDPKTV